VRIGEPDDRSKCPARKRFSAGNRCIQKLLFRPFLSPLMPTHLPRETLAERLAENNKNRAKSGSISYISLEKSSNFIEGRSRTGSVDQVHDQSIEGHDQSIEGHDQSIEGHDPSIQAIDLVFHLAHHLRRRSKTHLPSFH